MIDTIKIRLPLKEVTDAISELFHPVPLNSIRWSPKTHLATVLNPGKTVAKRTIYTPTYIGEKLIVNGAVSYYLAVEVSLPKLFFGNNVEELPQVPELVLDTAESIRWALERDLGLHYETEEIMKSEAAKLHVGKNFLFDDPGAPLFVIDTIYKSRADRLYDDNETKYENLGFSFRIHSNNKETIYYDKKKDIEQSKKSLKRAIDKSITSDLSNSDSPINKLLSDSSIGALRLEIRLNNRAQIKKAFPSISDDLSLNNILLHAPIIPYLESEWQKSTDAISAVRLSKGSISTTFGTIASKREHKYSLRDSLAVAAAATIIDEHGLNYLRSQIEKYYSKDAWYRFKKIMFLPDYCHPSYFKQIGKEIQNYNPITLREQGQWPLENC